ncbi:ABC transporter permease [Cruoricaptor ignavus]|uniref:ABC transporter permease n=1 Tax=Cruoricaptor ignavus TaxID=1118202 RepID=A0A7M1T0T9_9FLAO|nr:ABC transporter permease [Cruoricaptor ignavus]QOR73419.1 ABC transporter permease [Cruoricaptor ignavus]
MLYKIWRAIVKEFQILSRDIGGLIIIFLMPLLLIITITMIQDSSFRNFDDTKLPIIFIDKDKGEVSQSIRQSISESGSFEILEKGFDENSAKKAVFSGKYQMAVILPENLSKNLSDNINFRVESIIDALGYNPIADSLAQKNPPPETADIELYFDPAANDGFKNGMKTAIDKMIFQVENQKIYTAFEEQLDADGSILRGDKLISFKEITPNGNAGAKPNSVQHNVPAWSLFAIFLIVIPLSINLVQEKQQGTAIRLKTSPAPYALHLLGKTVAYLFICILQFLMMLAVGKWLFPLLGLQSFEVSGKIFPLMFLTVFAGLAAIGFGILVGTVFKTQEQSAPFGATAVVILAAIGGIWVPVFMMPEIMQGISKFSPMNWGLKGYYDIILRNAGVLEILQHSALLLLFYLVCCGASILYERKKSDV